MWAEGEEKITPRQVRLARLQAQRLIRHPNQSDRAGLEDLLKAIMGVQAQDPAAALLAIRARSRGLCVKDIEQAQVGEPSVARTWCMRGTLQLMAAADLIWLLPLLGPRFIELSARRYGELGLTPAICRDAAETIHTMLQGKGPLTKAQLFAGLAAEGFPTQGQAVYHLIRYAGLKGLLRYGLDRDGEPTFVEAKFLAEPPSSKALGDAFDRLARHYLAAFGPAGPEDLASWAGITLGTARSAFERIKGDLQLITFNTRAAWVLRSERELLHRPENQEHFVNLVPAFDPYLLGYKNRETAVPAAFARRIHPGGGIIRPAVLVDGQVVGTWRLDRRGAVRLVISPFFELSAAVMEKIKTEVVDIGRFLGTEVALRVRGGES